MRKMRRVIEAEVIAEFLRNEFYQEEFDRDRHLYEAAVMEPDINDEQQNALRRALLYRRRGHMWRELPRDVEWWEVEVEAADLERVRVFPRAQWRKISGSSFFLSNVVERLRNRQVSGVPAAVLGKIHLLRHRFLRADSEEQLTSVLLIGVDEQGPLTILEGNHRVVAGMLVSPMVVQRRFRVIAGFSPQMNHCCWYRTNFGNLWRYALNRMKNLYDREADVSRLRPVPQTEPAFAKAANQQAQETK